MVKKQITILIFVLLVLISGVGIVSAETLTGDLSNGGVWNSQNWWGNYTSSGSVTDGYILRMINIEYLDGLVSFIHFDRPGHPIAFANNPGDSPGNQTTFIAKIGSVVVGEGIIGYQRQWSGATEIEGYQYYYFNNWNGSQLYTGTQTVTITYNLTENFLFRTGDFAPVSGQPTGYISPGSGSQWAGSFTLNKFSPFENSYIANKPGGVGINGSVNKSPTGTVYPSRVYILNGDTDTVLTSDPTVNGVDFPFEAPSQTIKIAVYSSAGDWYNTSQLFTSSGVTPTPTPTPTPSPTVTLGPGQFWLTFSAEDATTGGLIPGAEIDIYSEFSGTWDNGTTSSGERTIATSQYHVYDAYGNASGYTAGEALDKIAYPNQNYLIKLFPSSGLPDVPGYVNLFVSVTERETGSPISGVSVSVNTPGSYTETGETDSTGTERFSTSNSSVKYITVSKTGYKSETRTITTPASGSYNAVLQMSRLTVTTVPTSYIPPGGVTPVRTVDPRSDSEKDIDMMNQIRDAGPDLIGLAIAVTFISLLGLMTKGFGK